jgi:hypothetical protein
MMGKGTRPALNNDDDWKQTFEFQKLTAAELQQKMIGKLLEVEEHVFFSKDSFSSC